jgi:hypothetical protein
MTFMGRAVYRRTGVGLRGCKRRNLGRRKKKGAADLSSAAPGRSRKEGEDYVLVSVVIAPEAV